MGPTQIAFQTQDKQKQLAITFAVASERVTFVVAAVQKTLQLLPRN